MDNFKLFSLIFSWGLVNSFKLFLIILFFIFIIYKIKRRYPCRAKTSQKRSDCDVTEYGKACGRELNDNF